MQVRDHLSGLRQDLDRQWSALNDAEANLRRAEVQWGHNSELRVMTGQETARRALKQAEKGLMANADEVATIGWGVAGRGASQLAPGPLCVPWSDPLWSQPTKGVALGRCVRVGSWSSSGGLGVPVVLPLVNTGGWVIAASSDEFLDLAHGALLRLFFAFNPTNVRVHTFDPEFTADAGLFADIRRISREAMPPAMTSTEELEACLGVLLDELGDLDDDLTSRGFDSLWEAAGSTGHLPHPLRVVFLNGPLVGLSDHGVARFGQLLRVGADRGLMVLAAEESIPAGLRSACKHLTHIVVGGGTGSAQVLGGVEWTPDPRPSRSHVLSACAALARAPVDTAPLVGLEELIEGISDPWLDTADQGLEAVIGVAGRNPLVLRLRSEDPPMPNALVGGAVGQGKSNLLLVIIHALAARYSPSDLQMVLVDLRDGVEFARLGPDGHGRNWLPHIKALGLEYDEDYGVAVLGWVAAEMSRRAALLRNAGVSKVADYRAATSKPMPRLLLVIDEFQRLFEGDDNAVQQAATLLEHISRTGRGFGVHVVLASQTLSGIRGLATKSDAIFAQFHNRVSLKNTPAESQSILAPQNLAAAKLTHRGEVIFNESLGQSDENTRGVVAKADEQYLKILRQRLWIEGGSSQPPQIFRSSAFAAWVDPPIRRPEGRSSLRFAVGAPIAIDDPVRELTLARAADQAVIVLGSDRTISLSVLCRAVRSAVDATARPRPRIALLDGDTPGNQQPAPWLQAFCRDLESRGGVVDRISRANFVPFVSALGRDTPDRPDLLVPIALDGVVDLDAPDPETFVAASETLRQAVRMGALHGTFTIGWWQSRTRCEDQLGYGMPGVRALAMCGVSRDDVQAICGPLVSVPRAHPRFLWFDRTARTGPETLVPFSVSDLTGGELIE